MPKRSRARKTGRLFRINYRQRPHAVEAQQHPFLPYRQASRMTSVSDWVRKDAHSFEFAPQLEEIIDFAVVDDDVMAIAG